MRKNIEFSVIFPIMNQADHIEEVIRSYYSALSKQKFSFELIGIVNGTTDKSFAICQRVAQQLPNVQVYELKGGGYGLGILHGIKYAGGDYLCYLNCARIKAPDLIKSLNVFHKHTDSVVHGIRTLRDTIAWRQLGSTIYNTYCRLLFGLSTSDVNGNPNIFSRDNFDKLQLSYTNSMIDLQLLDRAGQLGIRIIEVPIDDYSRYGGTSTSNFKTIFRLMREVLIYWKKTRVYKSI